jgi:hypothetical protein
VSQVRRLSKPFRVGVFRGSTQAFKPVATIGLVADGGLWVAPAPVRDFSWTYGPVRPTGSPEPPDHVEITQRPKLHYHQSGIVSVSLTGTALPLCGAQRANLRRCDD